MRQTQQTKQTAQKQQMKKLLPARRENSSKRDYGKVLIIAGTEGMMGAAVLCTRAALRSGAGLVTLCCPRAQFGIPQVAVPEAMCVPRDLSVLTEDYLNGFTAIAFGPGCIEKPEKEGPAEESAHSACLLHQILARILAVYQGVLVVDASGLDILRDLDNLRNLDILCDLGNLRDLEDCNRQRSRRCQLIVTPHCAEAARLLDWAYTAVKENRETAAAEIAKRYHAVALVKGPQTKIAVSEPGCGISIFSNTSGNCGMATGGAGDVLTGIIAGLSAQMTVSGFADETQNGKVDPSAAAAVLGAFLHGLAGDLAAEELGKYSLVAGDIIAYLPRAFLTLER